MVKKTIPPPKKSVPTRKHDAQSVRARATGRGRQPVASSSPPRWIIPAGVAAAVVLIPTGIYLELHSTTPAQPTPPTNSTTPSSTTSNSTPASSASNAAGTRTIQGPSIDMDWGPVQTTIIVKGKKIVNASATAPNERARSAYINSIAVPYLVQETLKAQSANIDLVTGATLTSEAYAQSLQGAIDSAHL